VDCRSATILIRVTDEPAETSGERLFFDTVQRMLGDRGYLFPLAAAQRQFRDAYYGMSAAALLEDLFFDAFNNYLHQSSPGVTLDRPERGQKGWDYQFDGTVVSHKVGRGPTAVAALWDATRTDLTHWSFESALMFMSSEYSPKRLPLLHAGADNLWLQPLSGRPDDEVKKGHGLAAVHWKASGEIELLGYWRASHATKIRELLPFRDLWGRFSNPISRGVPANELEVLRASAAACAVIATLDGSAEVERAVRVVEGGLRPGAYLFPRAMLQNTPVSSNNRAVLLSTETVAGLMRESVSAGLFAPIPTWFATWAPVRPPNLYLTQRAQYDQMFSDG
jgi:hypothetical protein